MPSTVPRGLAWVVTGEMLAAPITAATRAALDIRTIIVFNSSGRAYALDLIGALSSAWSSLEDARI